MQVKRREAAQEQWASAGALPVSHCPPALVAGEGALPHMPGSVGLQVPQVLVAVLSVVAVVVMLRDL